MTRFRCGTGVFGLALLVGLAFSGLVAGAAQAGEWKLGSQTFKELALEKEEVSGGGEGSTGFEVPEAKLLISCAGQTLTGTVAQGGVGQVSLELSKCQVTDLAKKSIPGCAVAKPILMKLTTGLVETGAGGMFDELVAEKEKAFATVELGKECPAGELLELKGNAAGEGTEASKAVQAFSFSQGTAKATGTSLVSGKQAAYMFGTIKMQLAAKNAGKEWGPLRAFLDPSIEKPDFGSVKVGASAEMGIVFKYLGSLISEQMSEGFVQNQSKADFSRVSETCKGRFFVSGETCEVVVKFAPTETGTRTGTLTLEEIGVLRRQIVVNLKGTGT